ncbi:MAG: hypothetical protein ABIN91_21765 [Mucilaginibacter sp.]|uniref:hypothetical protein n=1 Tax=Mucilaginibacter sp. TaxID=1882438 RepID=UPI003264EE38
MRSALIIFFFFAISFASAQHFDARDIKQLRIYEDSLKVLGKQFAGIENELERKNANYAFIKTLVMALKTPNSYFYPFDSLKNISIVGAPDSHFRLLTWHITNNDGSYRFYGAVQINTEKLQLHPLEDYSDYMTNPEDTITDNRKWLGAQYYKIIQPDAALPYYTLLGWKGSSNLSTKKVIDMLSFKDGKPVLGMAVFDGNGKTRKRVVFEYSRQASMLLKYIPERKIIVFDHLSPSEPKNVGKHETYGPDMSYSGYRYNQGRWTFADNLDMRNMPDSKDEQLLSDPKKAKSE